MSNGDNSVRSDVTHKNVPADATDSQHCDKLPCKSLHAESVDHLAGPHTPEYKQAFGKAEKSPTKDGAPPSHEKDIAKHVRPGSLDAGKDLESLAKTGAIVDNTKVGSIKKVETPENKPQNKEAALPKITIKMEDKEKLHTERPHFSIKKDGTIVMNENPEKNKEKKVNVVLERDPGQLNPTTAQKEASDELARYLSHRLEASDKQHKQAVVLEDNADVVSKETRTKNHLQPPHAESNMTSQTQAEIGKLHRFAGSRGIDMPATESAAADIGSFDSRRVPRQLNETDSQAAIKEAVSGLFKPDEKAPYETIRRTPDGMLHVGRYGLTSEQLEKFIGALGDPPQPAKLTEMINTGRLPQEFGRQLLQNPDLFRNLKGLIGDIRDGNVTATELTKFLPKELQEDIATDLIEKFEEIIGDKPGVISAAFLSGKSAEETNTFDTNSPEFLVVGKAAQQLYQIAKRHAQTQAESRNPGACQNFSGNIPQGQRRELIAKALELTGHAVTDSTLAAVNIIVEKESSWDPKSKNDYDSNAKAGNPSQGLMQTIPETFNRYAKAGYNKDIMDPLSNLMAGINYCYARYGSPEAVVAKCKSGGKNLGY